MIQTLAYIEFHAAGERLSGFRDALRRYRIACRNQQIRGGIFYAQTNARHAKILGALADEYEITLNITAKHGLRFRLFPYRKRAGLLCGMLLGTMFLCWCNTGVRSIEISGNERVSDSEILAALEDLGITAGVKFRDIPYTYIEQRMTLAVSDIERIAMRHIGGRLLVEIAEERQPPALVEKRIPTNYIAAVPAQITSMDVRGGKAVKKVGDVVKAGELLISGADTDQSGIACYYHADGIVKGIYPDEFVQEQPFVSELPVRGKTVTETLLSVFGRRFSLTLGFRPPDHPETLIYEEDTEPFMLFGRTLPLSLLHCRYTRQETAVTVFSEEEARIMLTAAAERYVHNFHSEDTLISQKADFTRTDLGIMLRINYVFEGVIGRVSENFVKLS